MVKRALWRFSSSFQSVGLAQNYVYSSISANVLDEMKKMDDFSASYSTKEAGGTMLGSE